MVNKNRLNLEPNIFRQFLSKLFHLLNQTSIKMSSKKKRPENKGVEEKLSDSQSSSQASQPKKTRRFNSQDGDDFTSEFTSQLEAMDDFFVGPIEDYEVDSQETIGESESCID